MIDNMNQRAMLYGEGAALTDISNSLSMALHHRDYLVSLNEAGNKLAYWAKAYVDTVNTYDLADKSVECPDCYAVILYSTGDDNVHCPKCGGNIRITL